MSDYKRYPNKYKHFILTLIRQFKIYWKHLFEYLQIHLAKVSSCQHLDHTKVRLDAEW